MNSWNKAYLWISKFYDCQLLCALTMFQVSCNVITSTQQIFLHKNICKKVLLKICRLIPTSLTHHFFQQTQYDPPPRTSIGWPLLSLVFIESWRCSWSNITGFPYRHHFANVWLSLPAHKWNQRQWKVKAVAEPKLSPRPLKNFNQ